MQEKKLSLEEARTAHEILRNQALSKRQREWVSVYNKILESLYNATTEAEAKENLELAAQRAITGVARVLRSAASLIQ